LTWETGRHEVDLSDALQFSNVPGYWDVRKPCGENATSSSIDFTEER
jgi:hypothetical protein